MAIKGRVRSLPSGLTVRVDIFMSRRVLLIAACRRRECIFKFEDFSIARNGHCTLEFEYLQGNPQLKPKAFVNIVSDDCDFQPGM